MTNLWSEPLTKWGVVLLIWLDALSTCKNNFLVKICSCIFFASHWTSNQRPRRCLLTLFFFIYVKYESYKKASCTLYELHVICNTPSQSLAHKLCGPRCFQLFNLGSPNGFVNKILTDPKYYMFEWPCTTFSQGQNGNWFSVFSWKTRIFVMYATYWLSHSVMQDLFLKMQFIQQKFQ